MTENKLKYMLERNKLDNIINNKSEAEELCKLETTEEVLDLLKKYNYNETKEVFERELLEILQISLSEEELNNVTGGRISYRQKLAALLGVISLTGAINIPTGATNTKNSVSAVPKDKTKEKQKRNSNWMAAPKEDKLAKALTGIVGVGGVVGVGSLLLYGGYKQLRKNTQKNMSNENPTNLGIMPPSTAPHEKWEGELAQINTIAVSLIQNPIKKYDELVAEINRDDLMDYAKKGLELWCENTKTYYDETLKSITNADAWNENFGLILKVRWAVWLLCLKDGKINEEDLQNHVQGRTYTKEQQATTFDTSPVWTEKNEKGKAKPLPGTIANMRTIWPGRTDELGNVKWTFWSIIEAMRVDGNMIRYLTFANRLADILHTGMPNWR